MRGAFWRPAYDVRLATDKGAKAQLELVRRAIVRQRTGEDWTGAQIAVSTARPGRGVKAPEVFTERLAFVEVQAMERARPQMSAQMDAASRQRVTSAPAPAPMSAAVEQEAVLEAGDYEAVFRIPGRIDVPGDGSERSLRIGSRALPPICRSAPRPPSSRPPISKPVSSTRRRRRCCPAKSRSTATASSWAAGASPWSRPAPPRASALAPTSA